MAVSKQPSITPETSSGEGPDDEPTSRGEAKWKRFHPFRVVRKIFRRRVKRQGTHEETGTSKKSWSTSELLSVQDPPEKYEVPSPPYKIGLSVSHDSIFSSESSNIVSTEELSRPQGSSLSVQHAGIKNMFKDELFSRVHARRDSDDDDAGLPRSPCASPTTVDVLNQGLKPKSLKSQTTCSAGSLISMGSSENDEDSFGASSSGNSSRMSLLERRSLDLEGDPDLSQPVPLNHKAALHKIAIRPKRTHGPPQKRLKQIAASKLSTLPATPEVTEDSSRMFFKSQSTTGMSMTSTSIVQETSSILSSSALLESDDKQIINASVSETNSGSTMFEQMQYEHRETHHSMQMFSSENLVHSMHVESKMQQSSITSSPSDINQGQPTPPGNIDFSSRSHILDDPKSLLSDIPKKKWEDARQGRIQDRYEDFIGDGLRFGSEWRNSSNLDSLVFKNTGKNSDVFSDDQIVDNDVELRVKKTITEDSINNKIDDGSSKPKTSSLMEGAMKVEGEDMTRRPISLPSDLPSGAPLCVSALVKSIEKSESGIKKDTGIKPNALRLSAKFESKKSDISAMSPEVAQEKSHTSLDGPQQPSQVGSRVKSPKEVVKPTLGAHTEGNEKVNRRESFGHSDPEQQQLLQNIRENLRSPFEQNELGIAIKHQFPQQKSPSHPEQACNIIPGHSPEEESIMSNKFMSIQMDNLNSSESCVVISHQVSDITEACNLVTVDKTFNMNVQGMSEKYEKDETGSTNQPWISSLDVTSSAIESNVSNITVNSKVYSHRAAEDKVTVSVNSILDDGRKPDRERLVHKNVPEKRISKSPVSKDKESRADASTSKISLSQGMGVKATKKTSPKVAGSDKENKSEKQTAMSQVKMPDPPKRLSVEIVPFSQRVKDRKYQPLAFVNKEAKADSKKPAAAGATVERNLSERRVASKGKEAEKNSNNRHSFSGVIQADGGKTSPEISVVKKHIVKADEKHLKSEDKQGGKAEKLHYPVEIRIHKNKNFEKESSAKPSFLKGKASPDIVPESDRLAHAQTKEAVRTSKLETESTAKWEVKVHSTASSQKKETSGHLIKSDTESSEAQAKPVAQFTIDHKLSDFDSEKSDHSYDSSGRSSQPNSLTSLPHVSAKKEPPRKPLKETPPSEEPEPELLRVFARRSIKQKHCDKDKTEGKEGEMVEAPSPSGSSTHSLEAVPKFPESQRTPSPSISNTSIRTPDDFERSLSTSPEVVKKKSKSFSEKEKPGPHYVKPAKEIILNRRPSLKVVSPDIPDTENFLHRQRLASEPDVTPILPPPTDGSNALRIQQNSAVTSEKTVSLSCRSEHLQRAASISISPSSTLSNGTSLGVDSLKNKENPDATAPSWLQLAQQRRELREQRERLLLGSSTNSFLDASSKPSRSSKVWDMVNNFQKMQMT